MDEYEVLREALIRAKTYAEQAEIEDDGGSCNFDSPVLLYRAMGYQKQKANEVIKDVGLDSYEPASKYWRGALVLCGMTHGQGYCRTAMAEAFAKSLERSGIESGMYYQMD